MKQFIILPIIFILSLISPIVISQVGNISDQITGEFIFDNVMGTSGGNPDIITINGSISIISYSGDGNDGFVSTINISSINGSIFNVIDSFEWDVARGSESTILHVNNITYAIVSRGGGTDGFIDTVNISDDGTILQSVVSSFEFDTTDGTFPDIIKVSDTIYAIAYTGAGSDGFLKTVSIGLDGVVNPSAISTFEFDTASANFVEILNITDNTFALVYQGSSPVNSILKTVNITSDGTTIQELDELIFDTSSSTDGKMVKIGEDTTYAVAYTSLASNGTIKTFEILDNGTIVQNLDTAQFDPTGIQIDLINVDANVIAITYSGVGSDGFVKTFNIQDNGTIGTEIDVLEFETVQVIEPTVTKMTSQIYAVAYEDSSAQGIIKTFNISSPVVSIPILNTTNLNVFPSKNPIEILEEFTLFANYTNSSDSTPVLNATCFANSSIVGGGQSGFGRGILGIGELSTLNNAVHTEVNDIFGNNTLRVDIDGLPLGKLSYGVNFRFHAHNQTPVDDLRIFATCHNNLSFSNFTLIGQVNTTEAVISTSLGNDTIWGFKNVVLFGSGVATSNCSVVFESQNTSSDKHWMIADTTTTFNLNNSFTSNNFGETYSLRPNANERSPFVDAGFGLDVPNETTLSFNATSGLYFLPNIRHGRPFNFNDTVKCSANNFVNASAFTIMNVQDNVNPIVQITSINPDPAIINVSNVTIEWSVNDPELLTNFINVSFPNGSLVIQSELKPLILTPSQLTVTGNYTVQAFANDTGGLSTTANDSFQVLNIDITPPVITLLENINNTINNTIPFNISFSVNDNFANDIICSLSNSSQTFDTGTFTQSTNSNLTLAEGELSLNQNFPDLELTCFDNSEPFNNSATVNINITLDTIPPIIFTIVPVNLATFNREALSSIQIKANCTDAPVFRFNITIENATDRIASFESRTPVNNFIIIDEILDISDLGIGDYTINYSCADPHTKQIIGNYNIKNNNSDLGINYVALDGNKFKIRYIDNATTGVTNFGSSKAVTNDRYKFWYDTGLVKSKTERTFTFEIIGDKPVYHISDSSYNGHFITGDNWIDFEFDDPDATFSVSVNENSNYEIAVTTTKTTLNFNSVGDLNVASTTTTFNIFSFAQIRDDTFSLFTCPLETLQRTVLFIFFIILSFMIMLLGFNWQHGLIGTLGALLLLILSAFLYSCIIAVGIILTALSIVIISFFVIKGTRSFT